MVSSVSYCGSWPRRLESHWPGEPRQKGVAQEGVLEVAEGAERAAPLTTLKGQACPGG